MSDTRQIISCPACGNNMRKVNIPDAGFMIDICTKGCGGILFDNQELKKILDFDECSKKIIEYLENSDFSLTDINVTRVCPVCSTPMVKIGGKSGVEIDSCNNCGAAFLDNGELKKIKEIIENVSGK